MSRPSLIIVLVLTSMLSVCPAEAGAPAGDIPALIAQLEDADFARREAAAKALGKLGRPAIEPLVKAAGTSPEVTSRAVGLLEEMMAADDPQTVDAADAALVKLLDSDDAPAATLAQAALARNVLVREQRAIEKIKELGGQVQVGPQVDTNGQPFPGLSFEQARAHRPRAILLGRDWKGGVEGLEHFRKLTHVWRLNLYVEQGCSVPLEQAQALASILPDLMVHDRGPYLGIQAASDPQIDCIIDQVKTGGPADKAGLQRHDRVLALEDQTIRSFHELVEGLKAYKIGDTVTLSVERDRQVIDVEVELEPWALAPVAENSPVP